MRSLLDDVLDSTVTRLSGPRIVSEVHDLGAINVSDAEITSALAGVAGVWDAAEMGISQAEVAKRIAEASTPEARERVLVDLRQRAVRRASLDTTGGRVSVMVAGKPAWHRLGVNVAEAVSAAEAIRLANLAWRVEKRPHYFLKSDGTYRINEDSYALVRADTEDVLGTVGTRYKVIQNQDGFDFLDTVRGEFGARFHTAGAIYNGAKVWMQCELPEHGFEVVRGDEVQAFATFTNPHDGSGKAWCFPTTERIVCANTFRTVSNDRTAGLGIRHTGNVRTAIGDARAALGMAVREIDTFKESADVMSRTAVDPDQFFPDLLDQVLDITAADVRRGASALAADVLAAAVDKSAAAYEAEEKRIRRQIRERSEIMAQLQDRYFGPKNAIGGIRGTAWGAFNTVTEYSDHTQPKGMKGNEAEKLSKRFESAVNGDGDQLKQTAFRMLTAQA